MASLGRVLLEHRGQVRGTRVCGRALPVILVPSAIHALARRHRMGKSR